MGWGCEGDKEIKGNRRLTEGPLPWPGTGDQPRPLCSSGLDGAVARPVKLWGRP